MNLYPPILFLVAEYDLSGRYTLSACRQNGVDAVGIETAQTGKYIAAVTICGHGVITKPAVSDIAHRVESDSDTFLSSRSGDTVSFFRRDRMSALEADIASRGIVPFGWFCTAAVADMPAVAAICTSRIRAAMNWRLLRPSDEGSAVLQVVVRRIYIPVLVLLLLLLSANAFLSPKLNAECERLRSNLAVRERIDSRRIADNEGEQALIRSCAVRPEISRALLCDRIAASVPEHICLLSIGLEPPVGRFEVGKPLQQRENMAEVTGSAPSSDDVSEFVSVLSENSVFGSVVLSSIERERNSASLNFRIDIEL